MLKIIFKGFDYNNVNGGKNDGRSNSRSIIPSKTQNQVAIFSHNCHKLNFSIKKKILSGSVINAKANHVKLRVLSKNLFKLNNLAHQLDLKFLKF